MEPQQLGLHRFNNGDNGGRFFSNERTETVSDPETGEEHTAYVYDIYNVQDARQPNKVKDAVISEEHPFGDEQKILRKTLAKVLRLMNQYDSQDFAEFRAYNEFCERV